MQKMMIIGNVLESTASTSLIQNQQSTVVVIEIVRRAINMKMPPIALTKENLAAFLRIRMKALRAEEQKFSFEIAK